MGGAAFIRLLTKPSSRHRRCPTKHLANTHFRQRWVETRQTERKSKYCAYGCGKLPVFSPKLSAHTAGPPTQDLSLLMEGFFFSFFLILNILRNVSPLASACLSPRTRWKESDSVFLQNVHRESKLTSRLSRTKRLETLLSVSSELLKFFFPQQI